MKNKELAEDPPKSKTRPVIVIQGKRNQAEAQAGQSSQVQQTPPRHAFGLNLIQGNQQAANEETTMKPEAEMPPVEQQAGQQLNPMQFEFIFNALVSMKTEVQRLASLLESLNGRIERLQDQRVDEPNAPRKKIRRKAQEILKSFTCPYAPCQKAYGSEVSLNLHVRLKHSTQPLDTKPAANTTRPSNQQGSQVQIQAPSSGQSHSGSESNTPGEDSK